MDGRPWLRLLLVVAGFGLMGFPVWNLTHQKALYSQLVVEKEGAVESLSIALSFSPTPDHFSLSHLEENILEGSRPAVEQTKIWKASLAAEGADLLFKAQWPKGTRTSSSHIIISHDGQTLVEKTFSVGSDLVEIVTIPGKRR